MIHIFCLIYWYCDNFYLHCKLQNIFTKAAYASLEHGFYQQQHKKVRHIMEDAEPLVHLWESAVLNYIFFFHIDRDL